MLWECGTRRQTVDRAWGEAVISEQQIQEQYNLTV